MTMRLKKSMRFEIVCVFCSFLLFLLASGCGSSGSAGDSDEDKDSNHLNFSVVLINEATGSQTDAISEGNPGILQITVTFDSGKAATGKLVTATPTKGSFSVSADGTDRTDGNGVAEIKLVAVNAVGESVTGAGEISVQSGEYEMETPFAFQIGVPDSTSLGAFINDMFIGGMLSSSLSPGETLSYGGTALIIADLVDGEGNHFDQPAMVQFTSQCGATLTPSVLTKNGQAVCVYTSNGCSNAQDMVTATVLKGGTDLTAMVSIPLAQEATGSIEFVSVAPSNIAVAGSATSSKPENSLVTFRVKDDKGNVMARELVFFSLTTTTGGITVSPLSRETDENGEVTALVKSGTVATSVRVKALAQDTSISTLSGNISIENTPLSESIGSILLTSGSVIIPADGQNQVTLRATVLNKSGLPIPAVDVNFSTTLGTLSAATAWTRSDGIAEVQLRSTSSGTAVITANAYGFLTNLAINFTSGASRNLSLEPAINNDGTIQAGESIDFHAVLRDNNGNTIPNEQINFAFLDTGNASGASLNADSVTTNASGIALVNYTAGDNPGVDWFGATLNSNQSISNSARMEVIQRTVTVGSMVISANPQEIKADGTGSSAITVNITDISGAPVAAGTEITFSTTLGLFSNGGTTFTVKTSDDSGSLTVPLISSLTAGNAKVTAESGGISQSVTVTFSTSVEPIVGSINLTATPTVIPADGISSSTIKAVINDTTGTSISQGQSVVFTTTHGTFPNGSNRYALSTPDDSGVVETSLIADVDPGTADITVTSGGITQLITVIFDGSSIADAAFISLSTSSTSIKTDGMDSATITAHVLGADKVPIEGTTVLFETSGGQISTASALTDENGDAQVVLSSANDKTNALVTITAKVQTKTATIPIQLSGSTVELDINSTSLQIGDETTLTITVTNGGGQPVYNALVNTESSGTGSISKEYPTGGPYTDVNGMLEIGVTAKNAGDVVLKVTALGDSKELRLAVSGAPFEIIDPTDDSVSENTGQQIQIRVRSPEKNNIKFTTTMGFWDNTTPDEDDDNVVSKEGVSVVILDPDGAGDPNPETANTAIAVFNTGNVAGVATIRVEDATNPEINDTLYVAISAPSSEAAKLTLQVAPSVIAPSTAGVTNVTTLKATVRNTSNQIVSDAAVMFSLFNTTGGGESISPPIVYTDSIGQAQTTFTSGARVSGSKGIFCLGRIAGASVAGPDDGFSFYNTNPDTIVRDTGSFETDGFEDGDKVTVTGSTSNDGTYSLAGVTATTLTLTDEDILVEEEAGVSLVIATTENTDVVSVVISGDASSVSIGGATVVDSYDDSTYKYPMSVLVSDSNGNSVAGATVNLSVWPTTYYTGVNSIDGPVRVKGYPNEDLNRNEILDIGEDTYSPNSPLPTSGNRQLDPAKSTAGSVPATVITDENGVAQFDYLYLKNYAAWLDVEVRATTLVYGSETSSVLEFPLGWSESEEKNLPNSPWGP